MSVHPIVAQPGHGSGGPPGLEYLKQLDQLLVHQMVELLEVVTGIETANRFWVKNSMGQEVFFLHEKTEICMRLCCGNMRGFAFSLTENGTNREVARISREFRCCYGCCWCATKGGYCAMEVKVEAPPGNVIGYARQGRSGCNPVYYVSDANRQDIFYCTRHCCMCQYCCCTGDLDFNIYPVRKDGKYDKAERVACISKQWGGCVREVFTKASNFSINFPKDLDVNMKLILLALTLQVDFQFFEQNKKNNGN